MFPFFGFLIPSSRIWLEFILDMTIKSIFIIGVALFILLIGKRTSFITRHLVLILAIVSILLIPLFSYILPKWEISLLPSVLPEETTAMSFKGFEKVNAPIQNIKQNIIPDYHSSQNQDYLNARTNKQPHWPVWLFILWLAGATGVSAWSIAGIIGTRIIIKKAIPVKDNTFNNLALSSAKKLGVRRKIRLLQGQKSAVPLTCGWLHPAIVVPEEIESWPKRRKEIVLLHELAHIKRGDFLLNLITLSVSIIYWFNPLIWVALKKITIERERASDDYVLALGTKASEYALHLVEIARRFSSMKWFSPAGISMAKKSNLEVRIMSILSNKKPRIRIRPLTIVFICFLAISFIMPISSIHTWAQSEEKQKADLPDKEAIKKTLSEFYKCIELMDFSNAIRFLAKLPDLPVFEKYPLVILEKEKDHKTWTILTVKHWKDLSVNSVIMSIEKQPDHFVVKEKLTVEGTDKCGERHIIVNNPEHALTFVRKDGKWKIIFEGLKTEAIDIPTLTKETDKEKESKKMGIVFSLEGINCIILHTKPCVEVSVNGHIKLDKKHAVKVITTPHVKLTKGVKFSTEPHVKYKKGVKFDTKHRAKLKEAVKIDTKPYVKIKKIDDVIILEPNVEIDLKPAVKINKNLILTMNKKLLKTFKLKHAIKLDKNFVLVLDKKNGWKVYLSPITIKIQKELLKKIKEKKKDEIHTAPSLA
ncbi:MAG: M56 family metallopeptidase [Candidatus Aminicenantes bacterium]|nr:MAG: M56 family metallopeptidase [Candidatus Aminicenantes bacterium]